MRRPGSFRQEQRRQLDEAIHACRTRAAHQGVLPAYDQLIDHVRTRTDLLDPSDRPGDRRTGFNAAMLALSLCHRDWLRPVSAWLPAQLNPWPLFASLAQHLLARYPVPPFMTAAWFGQPAGERQPEHDWYRRLGRGENIRAAGLPLRLTRAMAHLFSQAPHHYAPVAAVRWAQVRGLGGSPALARAVVASRLGRALAREEFWESVLIFFVNHPDLDLDQVGPVVDYLQYQKFEWGEGVADDGVFSRSPPPRPDYSIKGRTTASVLRQVREWHRQLGMDGARPQVSWPRSAIREFRLVEEHEPGGARVWTIREIVTSRELFVEGQMMRHCVATYLKDCLRGQASIWSVQVESVRGRFRALTAEVDVRARAVRQVRGRCNRWPTDRERAVVERWAKGEGLRTEGACGV